MDPRREQDPEPGPPLLGRWSRVYWAVLLHLAFWIVVFSLFTLYYDRPR